MSKKSKVISIVVILLLMTSCVAFLIFGLPAIAHGIDGIIAAGPGSIVTAILSMLFSYYFLIPLILIVAAVIALVYLYRKYYR